MNPFSIAALAIDDGELADGTGGVYIRAETLPLTCHESCGGLGATGGGAPEGLLAIGIVLTIAGVAFLVTRMNRRRIRN